VPGESGGRFFRADEFARDVFEIQCLLVREFTQTRMNTEFFDA
jgi:hypothetical protein